MTKKQSIAAVVVALDKEIETKNVIYSLQKQSRKPDEIIVVYQGVSESILNWLKTQDNLNVYVQKNAGSAGGFSKGMELAIANGHDWVWVTDDDAVPALNALEELTNCPYFDSNKTGLLSSVILDKDGNVYMSPVPKDANQWYKTVLQDKCVLIRSCCWPGSLIPTQAILDYGLPISEYFFYDEDIEFTSRIARNRPSYCVISSHIVHYQQPSQDMWKSPARYKCYVRNKFATIRLSDDSFVKITAKLWLWFFKIIVGIVTRKIPIGAIKPLFEGLLFFRPKIKYPNQVK